MSKGIDINPYGPDSLRGPGFHGDLKLIEFVDTLLKRTKSFIETGTNIGNTLYFVSRNYDISCYSCEVHHDTPAQVVDHENVVFKNMSSPNFIYHIVKEDPNMADNTCMFWLDAHYGGGEETLFKEIGYIINNFKSYYIFADDIDINNSIFSHNGYSVNKIKQMASSDNVYVPNYTEQTSDFHCLTGWCLITNHKITIPDYISEIKI